MKKYKRIYFSKEGKWHIAEFPLLDIVTQGKTKKKAENNLMDLIGLWTVVFLEKNTVDDFIKELRS